MSGLTKLKEYRLKSGDTLTRVAVLCHTTPSHVSHIENGQRLPSYRLFTRLCNYYKIIVADRMDMEMAIQEALYKRWRGGSQTRYRRLNHDTHAALRDAD